MIYDSLWLSRQAFWVVIAMWPITLFLFFLLCLALVIEVKKYGWHYLRFFYSGFPLLGTIGILLVGSIFQNEPQLFFLPYVFLSSCLAISIIVIIKQEGMRATALTMSMFIIWYSFWCALFSVASITGNWL